MHIGFVTTESPYGDRNSCGIAAYLRAMVPALVEAGHRVTVFANSKQNREFQTDEGVSVHHFQLPSIHWYASKIPGLRHFATLPLRQLEWSAAFYRRVAPIVKRDKIDVLESTETGALFLNRLAPLVIRMHGSEFAFRKHSGLPLNPSVRWNDSLEAVAGRRAVAITAPSQFQANEIIARRGWSRDRVHVIPNPISGTMLEAGLQSERNEEAEPVVLYTGRLAPVKGIETLLSTAKLVHERNARVRFVLAGPWQMPQPPAAYGLELNRESSDRVQWIGALDHDDLKSWYRRATLFAMPSHFESFGISVVEAMAFGLPVICTNAGALAEIVEDGVSGRLVPAANADAMAEAILDLVDSPVERESLSEAAQSQVQNRFSAEQAVNATLRVYASVTGIAFVSTAHEIQERGQARLPDPELSRVEG